MENPSIADPSVEFFPVKSENGRSAFAGQIG